MSEHQIAVGDFVVYRGRVSSPRMCITALASTARDICVVEWFDKLDCYHAREFPLSSLVLAPPFPDPEDTPLVFPAPPGRRS